jgi:hypothetical protein
MKKQQEKEPTQEEVDRREAEYDKAQRDSILARYHRPVIAYPDGAVVHHGDCQIFDTWGVCTCGLIHDLMWCHFNVAEEIYPDYGKDRVKHEYSMYELMLLSIVSDNPIIEMVSSPVFPVDNPSATPETLLVEFIRNSCTVKLLASTSYTSA